jgi:farnesyl diphosphate synthase
VKKQKKKYQKLLQKKMQNKLNKIAEDTNLFLKKFIKKQKKSELIIPMQYGLFSGGKKIRSKILIDIGSLFKLNYKLLIIIGAAVECIHAYSLIHDDLPCMDNDSIRRGKPSTHIKFGESTAVLAGNSLLTMAFEILSNKNFNISEKIKNDLINKISESSGHLGIAGGQYLDLSFEHKKISKKRIIEMEIKKTGKLFSFCCVAPLILRKKNKKEIKKFESIGADIGLLFQVADDLIDYKGNLLVAGKKTGKDKKKGKATLISLLGHENTIKYANKLIFKINSKLKKYGSKGKNLSETLDYILNRNK